MLVNNKILDRVLKEWQHFPWQEEQFHPLQFQVHCRQHSGSAASFPIVWLVPTSKDSNQCTLSVKPMNQRKIFTLNQFFVGRNWIFLDRMSVNFSSGTSFPKSWYYTNLPWKILGHAILNHLFQGRGAIRCESSLDRCCYCSHISRINCLTLKKYSSDTDSSFSIQEERRDTGSVCTWCHREAGKVICLLQHWKLPSEIL